MSYDQFTYGKFFYDDYRESADVRKAENALNAHLKQKPVNYKSQWNNQLNGVMDKILNREKFSYDINGDALYQQYKDKYVQQGKMASADVMGQASAMTGGYGNSYAASVGNQAYQASLQQLNDKVPELYQMAYDRYAQEGQDLLNQYGVITDREDTDYGRYRDKVSDYITERDYLANRYDAERNFDYTKYADNRDFSYNLYSDNKAYAYQDHQDQAAYDQWLADHELADRQIALQEKAYEDSKVVSDTPEIDPSIRDKAASFESNTDLADYLDGLEASNVITPEQSDALFAEYVDSNEIYVDKEDGSKKISYKGMLGSTNGWEVLDYGGVNLWGIDKNAKVKAPNGEVMTLGNLRDKLKQEGMTHSEATNAIKDLQQNTGISSNWMFGW